MGDAWEPFKLRRFFGNLKLWMEKKIILKGVKHENTVSCHGLSRVLVVHSDIAFVCLWRDSPQWARASSFTRFLDHTQRRTTVGRTPLTSDQPVAETST